MSTLVLHSEGDNALPVQQRYLPLLEVTRDSRSKLSSEQGPLFDQVGTSDMHVIPLYLTLFPVSLCLRGWLLSSGRRFAQKHAKCEPISIRAIVLMTHPPSFSIIMRLGKRMFRRIRTVLRREAFVNMRL